MIRFLRKGFGDKGKSKTNVIDFQKTKKELESKKIIKKESQSLKNNMKKISKRLTEQLDDFVNKKKREEAKETLKKIFDFGRKEDWQSDLEALEYYATKFYKYGWFDLCEMIGDKVLEELKDGLSSETPENMLEFSATMFIFARSFFKAENIIKKTEPIAKALLYTKLFNEANNAVKDKQVSTEYLDYVKSEATKFLNQSFNSLYEKAYTSNTLSDSEIFDVFLILGCFPDIGLPERSTELLKKLKAVVNEKTQKAIDECFSLHKSK